MTSLLESALLSVFDYKTYTWWNHLGLEESWYIIPNWVCRGTSPVGPDGGRTPDWYAPNSN